MAADLPPDLTVVLGSAWAGNSINCAPFRLSGVLKDGSTRHVAYYNAEGAVELASIADGILVARAILPVAGEPADAHLAISMGLDGDGRLHVAYGAHNSRLRIARALGRDLAAGFSEPEVLAGESADSVTYPMFLRLPHADDLILLFRNGSADGGEIRCMRFECNSGSWRDDPRVLISGRVSPGAGKGPYLNTPAVGPRGEVVLFLVWRRDSASIGGGIANTGIACLVSHDGLRSLVKHGGHALALPVTSETAGAVIPVGPDMSLINQASAAVRSDGTPMVLTYWDDEPGIPQFRLGWPEGACWRVATVSRFTTRFGLSAPGTLPLPHSRPELLLDADGTANIIFRSREMEGRLMMTSVSPPDYALASARHRVLLDEDLGYYEPVVDRTGWADGDMTMYVQYCDQKFGGDDSAPVIAQAPARLMTWRRERLR